MKTKAMFLSAIMMFASAILSAAPAVQSAAAGQGDAPKTAQAPKPADKNEVTVYVTNTGKKYHAGGCRSLSKSKIPMPLKDAAKTYSPCSVCHPPVVQ